jgi:hypothetical protein
LHVTFRKNRSRSRTKIWFVTLRALPVRLCCGSGCAKTAPPGLRAASLVSPALFNHQAPQPPASSGGLKHKAFYKVAKILPGPSAKNAPGPGKTLVRNAPAQAGRLPLKAGKNHRPPLQPTRLTSALKVKCFDPLRSYQHNTQGL